MKCFGIIIQPFTGLDVDVLQNGDERAYIEVGLCLARGVVLVPDIGTEKKRNGEFSMAY